MNKEEKEVTEEILSEDVTSEVNIDQEEVEAAPELSETEKLQGEVLELKDKFLRLQAEFDNFRRRTAKERLELIQTASKDLVSNLIPVLDDFERANKNMETATDVQAIKEGIDLVYSKFYKVLEAKGLKPMNSTGETFNPEIHEAITQIPAPSKNLVGKVVDEVEKGYYLNDTVVRFAKVVIGA
jgi:molecular chaperone GrpE